MAIRSHGQGRPRAVLVAAASDATALFAKMEQALPGGESIAFACRHDIDECVRDHFAQASIASAPTLNAR
jgi:hypothetical protein